MLPSEETRYVAYSPIIARQPLALPDGARVAVWFVPNVEHYEFVPPPNPYRNPWPRTPHPDVMSYSYREYGNRVAFWRMLEVFDHYALPITASVSVSVLEHLAEIRDAMVSRNWEMMSHGLFNTRFLYGMDVEEERAFLKETKRVIYERTGQKVAGMLAPAFTSTVATYDLMAEEGFCYTADWFLDDQPFPVRAASGRLCGIPYSKTLNDGFVIQGQEADYFEQICKDQFDVLYQEGETSGRVMCVALHPYLMGQPHRIRYLAGIIDHIVSHDKVWVATGRDIADWYLANRYEDDLAPGSQDPR